MLCGPYTTPWPRALCPLRRAKPLRLRIPRTSLLEIATSTDSRRVRLRPGSGRTTAGMGMSSSQDHQWQRRLVARSELPAGRTRPSRGSRAAAGRPRAATSLRAPTRTGRTTRIEWRRCFAGRCTGALHASSWARLSKSLCCEKLIKVCIRNPHQLVDVAAGRGCSLDRAAQSRVHPESPQFRGRS
eukprot:COSAG04_NODE_1976_length_5095_cov_2.657326_2_plen_186_part_00